MRGRKQKHERERKRAFEDYSRESKPRKGCGVYAKSFHRVFNKSQEKVKRKKLLRGVERGSFSFVEITKGAELLKENKTALNKMV